MKRGLATGLTMLGMLLLFAGLAELFGQVFVSQLSQLGSQLPGAVTSAIDWVNSTFGTQFDIEQIQTALSLTPDKLGELAGKYGGGIIGIFGSVITFLFDALTILVFAYYFSADSPRLRQTIGSWLPQRYQRVFITVWTISVEKTGGYVVSSSSSPSLSAVFHVAFFWFIDVPFWLPLGIFAGIVGQFIPTIGTYIGVALPALFALLDKPINALWIAVFATVYQQIENYVFTPRISRRTMDVHPAVALGSVIAGAASSARSAPSSASPWRRSRSRSSTRSASGTSSSRARRARASDDDGRASDDEADEHGGRRGRRESTRRGRDRRPTELTSVRPDRGARPADQSCRSTTEKVWASMTSESCAARAAGTALSTLSTPMARSPWRETCMPPMLMPASPRIRPTAPMTPGRSEYSKTSMCSRERHLEVVAVDADELLDHLRAGERARDRDDRAVGERAAQRRDVAEVAASRGR